MDKTKRVILRAFPLFMKSVAFSDSFDRADGAIGGRWTVQSGTWTILSNQAKCTVAGNATVPCAVNVDISAKIIILDGTGISVLVARYVDENNYVRAVLNQAGAWNIAKVLAGTPTTVVSGSGVAYTDLGTLRLVAKGTLFALRYRGALLGSGTIANAALQTSALCGMRGVVAGKSIFDDFLAKRA